MNIVKIIFASFTGLVTVLLFTLLGMMVYINAFLAFCFALVFGYLSSKSTARILESLFALVKADMICARQQLFKAVLFIFLFIILAIALFGSAILLHGN